LIEVDPFDGDFQGRRRERILKLALVLRADNEEEKARNLQIATQIIDEQLGIHHE
jgi:hypothetical protein